jgi:hypothetical protein
MVSCELMLLLLQLLLLKLLLLKLLLLLMLKVALRPWSASIRIPSNAEGYNEVRKPHSHQQHHAWWRLPAVARTEGLSLQLSCNMQCLLALKLELTVFHVHIC